MNLEVSVEKRRASSTRGGTQEDILVAFSNIAQLRVALVERGMKKGRRGAKTGVSSYAVKRSARERLRGGVLASVEWRICSSFLKAASASSIGRVRKKPFS